MRRQRSIYFNDARHYYLFVFEPPMALEDAWRPVDEVAGTSVDTFIYGVARGDGLFYPTKAGKRFGLDIQPFESQVYWRVWGSMQSLIDRGLDPLRVLVDRAHDKGMDFFASFRMGTYEGVEPPDLDGERGLADPAAGGRGLADPKAREHQFAVLQELATQYPIEGLELDFAMAPGGGSQYLRDEDVAEHTSTITAYVRRLAEMVRGRPGGAGQLGARVYPTEEMNRATGLDVRTWLREGLLDYVTPMMYHYLQLDADMPFDWLVEAAHEADVSVYGMLQPYVKNESRQMENAVTYAPQEAMRAAQASYWARGVDGHYTWFMSWPLGDAERRVLTELGDRDLIKEGTKHYILRSRQNDVAELGYDAPLPCEIASAGSRCSIPFYIADDIEGASDRIRQVRLKIRVGSLVSSDRLSVLLNGESLAGETCLRDYARIVLTWPSPHIDEQYSGQWLEFLLRDVRPRQGDNVLDVSLDGRPEGLVGGVSVDDVEVIVEYGPYPSAL